MKWLKKVSDICDLLVTPLVILFFAWVLTLLTWLVVFISRHPELLKR